MRCVTLFFFFFNDTATTEIYTLSLHDALPISPARSARHDAQPAGPRSHQAHLDRKSTRLNSSHGYISYAVFCLKKKNQRYEERAALVLVKLRTSFPFSLHGA